MKNYKLREGENARKPSVKRDLIEIRVPVLLLCLALAFLVWLYIVSISKIDPTDPLESQPDTGAETASAGADARVSAVETASDYLTALLSERDGGSL